MLTKKQKEEFQDIKKNIERVLVRAENALDALSDAFEEFNSFRDRVLEAAQEKLDETEEGDQNIVHFMDEWDIHLDVPEYPEDPELKNLPVDLETEKV